MAACGGLSRARRFLGLLPFLIWAAVVGVASEASASRQRSEVWRHLKRLNKPAVKSIQSPDGDIIDCVHLSHQPAFDHPLLKNHTIQMMPSFPPEGLYDQNKVRTNSGQRKNTAITQMWHLRGRCPENTIPIRRTKREDILRASSVKSYGRKKHGSIPKPVSASLEMFSENRHQHAIGYVVGGIYHGAKATMNVWNPRIQQPNEFSLSQIWVLRGAYYVDLNSIEAGWQVSADLYGDNNTRLFTYWTSDAYHTTGCYNLLCSGFIQVNNRIAMGASISPISTYSGSQFDITILVWKDKKEGNWWMQFGDAYVGYWPSFLFSFLGDSASMIQWGGEVVNSEPDGQHTSTEMGSGHFPEEGFSKASYFKNIQIVDESNTFRAPEGLQPFTEQSSCYNVQIVDDGGDWGNHFYYGGPGRNENCP